MITPTPTCLKVWQLAKQEAERMNEPFIGTQHLLLALVKCQESIAKPFLESFGVTLGAIRDMPYYAMVEWDHEKAAKCDEPVTITKLPGATTT